MAQNSYFMHGQLERFINRKFAITVKILLACCVNETSRDRFGSGQYLQRGLPGGDSHIRCWLFYKDQWALVC